MLSELEKIEQKINFYLPSATSPNFSKWEKDCFGNLNSAVEAKHILPLTQPPKDLISLGGKRWRPLFLVLCAKAVTESKELPLEETEKCLETAYNLTPMLEFVHTASLIHDDLEDNSSSRRGKPAAYITYGTDVAVNSATWLYFNAALCIQNLDASTELKNQLYSLYFCEIRRLHLGQAMDISWHRNIKEIPSLEQYSAMVQNKTGTLSSFAAKTGALSAGANLDFVEEVGKIAAQLGEAFQILDDCINLKTGNPGKKRGDDIVEGKKSLPVLLFFEKCEQTEKDQIFDYFKQAKSEGIESPSVEKAILLLEKYDCVNLAEKRGLEILEKSLCSLEGLFGNTQSVQSIKELFLNMVPPSLH